MNAPDRNRTNSKTILVLDGDVVVRLPVAEFLRDCDYHVVEAATTDEAIEILQKTKVLVDVLLSEIDVPGSMNGLQFAELARSLHPGLQILLAGTPGRTLRNAAELCVGGPKLKRPYDQPARAGSRQPASRRSNVAGRELIGAGVSMEAHHLCRIAART
jgi:CheY-like chemotaxis protein